MAALRTKDLTNAYPSFREVLRHVLEARRAEGPEYRALLERYHDALRAQARAVKRLIGKREGLAPTSREGRRGRYLADPAGFFARAGRLNLLGVEMEAVLSRAVELAGGPLDGAEFKAGAAELLELADTIGARSATLCGGPAPPPRAGLSARVRARPKGG
jgi:hypothetical protein